MAVGNVFNFLGSIIPLGIGVVAQKFGLQSTMWLIMLSPAAIEIDEFKKLHYKSKCRNVS